MIEARSRFLYNPVSEMPLLPERREDFLTAWEKLQESTPDRPYLQSLLLSAIDEYESNPDFPPVIDRLLETAPYGGATMDVYKFYKTLVAMELSRDPGLPVGRETPDDWKPTLQKLMYDNDYKSEFLFKTLLPNNANIPQRSAVLAAVMAADGRGYPLTGIEVASSVMLNMQMLLLHGRREGVNYEDVTVMNRLLPDESHPYIRYVPDPVRTRKFNQVIKHAPLVIKKAVGIDILGSPDDIHMRDLARVNSFRLGELMDDHKKELFDTLIDHRSPQIGFHHDDAAYEGFDYERLFKKHPEVRECDFIFISTVMYMLNEAQRKQMLDNFIPLLRPPSRTRPAGRLVLLDYISESRPGNGIKMHKYWDPYESYGAWTYKADEPDMGIRKIMSVEEGRVRRVVYEPALGRLAWAGKLLG